MNVQSFALILRLEIVPKVGNWLENLMVNQGKMGFPTHGIGWFQ
jgi:hypothetical protein